MAKQVYLEKTIALLELTGGYSSNDLIVKKTFEFYWKNFKNDFQSFIIVDTGGSVTKTIDLLEKYYKMGYRYFFGFSRSTVLQGVLDWFNMHPDAIGISPTSTAPNLSIPKRIFRMTPTDNYILDPIYPHLYSASTVYYIYTDGEVAMTNVLNILQNNPSITNLQALAITPSTPADVVHTFLNGSSSSDVIVTYLLDREPYIQYYTEGLTFDGQQYDILGIQPPKIPYNALDALIDKYNIVSFKGIATSELWRMGYNTLGEDQYSIVSLNSLHLINYLVYGEDIMDIDSHFGILQFDEITRDLIFPSFLVQTLTDYQVFSNNYLTVNDPLLGTFTANFSS